MYHTDGFVDIEEHLHPWDKSHLIMMYNPFIFLFFYFYLFIYLFIYFVFLPFLGLLPRHMEIPRLGV